MGWTVEIEGGGLEFLADLTSELPTKVVRSGKGFALVSDRLEEMPCRKDAERDVEEFVYRQIRLFNSLVRIGAVPGIDCAPPVRLKKIVLVREGKPTTTWDCEGEWSVLRNENVDRDEARREVARILSIAETNSRVSDALELFGASDGWSDLHKIYEIISGEVGGDKGIAKRGWSTEKQLERFAHTANTWQAIGLDARHVNYDKRPPDKPMDHFDARRLICRLLKGWLGELA